MDDSDKPIPAERVRELLAKSAPGANALLRELNAARLRASRLHDLVLREIAAERATRGLRERVLWALTMEEMRRPRLG